MSKVEVYEKPMCCPTGICGPHVDPDLPRFAGDLAWLRSQGHLVERFNLAQQPAAFTVNRHVQQLLQSEGMDCLPLVLVDGRVVSRSNYPTREDIALWTGTPQRQPTSLPVVSEEGCCGDTGCC